jgi:hypothetical protein
MPNKSIHVIQFVYIIFLVQFIGFYLPLTAQKNDTVVPPPSVNVSQYPWLHTELNMLQFYDAAALAKFYNKWKNTDKEKLTVLHFGDSHCQHEALPGTVRKRCQAIHGAAGRGLMFPYSTAKTYTSVEYYTSHTGTWTSERGFTMLPKLPMGVRGMTCRTELPAASMTFQFVENVPEDYTRIKIFCKHSPKSYDLKIEVNDSMIPVVIDQKDKEPYILVEIPSVKNRKLTFHVVKTNPNESEFEFYGMSLESHKEQGLIYHNAGVGAARWNSLLFQELLWEQITTLNPDLIVLDYGTNDFLYDDKIRPALESEIRTVISKMKEAAPNASFIITSASDLFFKKRNCKAGEPFSDMIHRIAADTKCAVYDWYWISGGQGSMEDWVKSGLAQPDYVHLAVKGYELKGNLFFDAINHSMQWLDKNPLAEEYFFKLDSLKAKDKIKREKILDKPVVYTQPQTARNQVSGTAVPVASTVGRTKYIHNITNGESLYSIGRKYNVTINQLKSWNGMVSDKIIAGKTLFVWIKR